MIVVFINQCVGLKYIQYVHNKRNRTSVKAFGHSDHLQLDSEMLKCGNRVDSEHISHEDFSIFIDAFISLLFVNLTTEVVPRALIRIVPDWSCA